MLLLDMLLTCRHRLKEMVGSDSSALDIARKEYQLKSRDHARLPVQVSIQIFMDTEYLECR